mmetsp:Transcript_118009/g.330446  ORF Transcript_118009/g.330446 Transcript_118009/m.330446 type:complete len:347 (+) Transcript_118009:169-1209(+)
MRSPPLGKTCRCRCARCCAQRRAAPNLRLTKLRAEPGTRRMRMLRSLDARKGLSPGAVPAARRHRALRDKSRPSADAGEAGAEGGDGRVAPPTHRRARRQAPRPACRPWERPATCDRPLSLLLLRRLLGLLSRRRLRDWCPEDAEAMRLGRADRSPVGRDAQPRRVGAAAALRRSALRKVAKNHQAICVSAQEVRCGAVAEREGAARRGDLQTERHPRGAVGGQGEDLYGRQRHALHGLNYDGEVAGGDGALLDRHAGRVLRCAEDDYRLEPKPGGATVRPDVDVATSIHVDRRGDPTTVVRDGDQAGLRGQLRLADELRARFAEVPAEELPIHEPAQQQLRPSCS